MEQDVAEQQRKKIYIGRYILIFHQFNEIRKVIVQIVKTFIGKIKEKNNIVPLEFHHTIVRLFNVEDFRAAQDFKIKEEGVKEVEKRYPGDVKPQITPLDRKRFQSLQKARSFNVMHIKALKTRHAELFGGRAKSKTMSANNSPQFPNDSDVVSRDEFKKLVTEVLMQDAHGSRELVDNLDLDQIYEAFDSDKNGRLDFKYFLSLYHVLINQ